MPSPVPRPAVQFLWTKISLNFCSGSLLHATKILVAASRSCSDLENIISNLQAECRDRLVFGGDCNQLPLPYLGSELRAADFLLYFFGGIAPFLPAIQRPICNVGLSPRGPHMHPMTRQRDNHQSKYNQPWVAPLYAYSMQHCQWFFYWHSFLCKYSWTFISLKGIIRPFPKNLELFSGNG